MTAYYLSNGAVNQHSHQYSSKKPPLGYKLIWWLFAGTRGGPTRADLVGLLEERPLNANQISRRLGLDYKTIRHHLDILVKNQIVSVCGERYGLLYMLSDNMRESYLGFLEVRDKIHETQRKGRGRVEG